MDPTAAHNPDQLDASLSAPAQSAAEFNLDCFETNNPEIRFNAHYGAPCCAKVGLRPEWPEVVQMPVICTFSVFRSSTFSSYRLAALLGTNPAWERSGRPSSSPSSQRSLACLVTLQLPPIRPLASNIDCDI